MMGVLGQVGSPTCYPSALGPHTKGRYLHRKSEYWITPWHVAEKSAEKREGLLNWSHRHSMECFFEYPH